MRHIEDSSIIHYWYAPQANDEMAEVNPDWYEQNGIPISQDGEDMVYSHTEVHLPQIDMVREAIQQRNGMFYTPETKADANKWVKAQPLQMPTGVAFMVGFNYALRQIERIVDSPGPEFDPDAEVTTHG